MIIRRLITTMLLLASFAFLNYAPAHADDTRPLRTGGPYADTLCQYLQGQQITCEVTPLSGSWYSGLCRSVFSAAPWCISASAEGKALQKIRKGEIDLAVVSTALLDQNDQAKVILLTTTKKDRVLIASSKVTESTVSAIIDSLFKYFKAGLPRNPLVEGKQPASMEPFIAFDKPMPLHQGVLAYFSKNMGDSLRITYATANCDRKKKAEKCIAIIDAASIDMRLAKRFADIGISAAPFLFSKLEDENPYVRLRAAYALGDMWPQDAPKFTSALLARLSKEQNDDVREEIIRALGKIEPAQETTLSILRTLVQQEPNPRPAFEDGSYGMGGHITKIRRSSIPLMAAKTLVDIDVNGLEICAPLLDSLSDTIRLTGVECLQYFRNREYGKFWRALPRAKSGRDQQMNLPITVKKADELILRAYQKGGESIRQYFLAGYLGLPGPELIPTLAALLLEPDQKKKCYSQNGKAEICEYPTRQRVLQKLGYSAKYAGTQEVFNGLLWLILHGEEHEFHDIISTLYSIMKYHALPDEITVALQSRLKEIQNINEANKIKRLLESIALYKDLEVKLPLLRKEVSENPDVHERANAADTLTEIANGRPSYAPQAVQFLAEALQKEADADERRFLIEKLKSLKELAAPAASILAEILEKNLKTSDMVAAALAERTLVIDALSQIKSGPPAVVQALTHAVEWGMMQGKAQEKLVISAGHALIQCYETPTSANPVIEKLLNSSEAGFIKAGLLMIENGGAETAKPFFARIETLSQSGDREIQGQVERVMGRIDTPETQKILEAKYSRLKASGDYDYDWIAFLAETYAVLKKRSEAKPH